MVVDVHLVDRVKAVRREVEGANLGDLGGDEADRLLVPLGAVGVLQIVPTEVGADAPIRNPIRAQLT